MKILNYIKQNAFAFIISLLYVTFGGIVACSMYPDDPLNGDWWIFGWLATFPVNIFGSGFVGEISFFLRSPLLG
jgi:hypothetical protein